MMKQMKAKPAGRAASKKREAARVTEILRRLQRDYPDAVCALHFRSPFELLVATILSAQCTDARVNMVTPVLFGRFPDPVSLSKADPSEVEEIIKSTGFFRNKTKSLVGASKAIVELFGGQVPRTMEELLQLPGVARKTANVVLGTAYGVAAGVVVDTHVTRVSNRLALTKHEDPVKIESDLMSKVPKDEWIAFSHRVIHHGRRVCRAPRPICQDCSLPDVCLYYQTEVAR